MEDALNNVGPIVPTWKRLVRRLLAIGENRLALLLVEVQEERERLLHAILLALAMSVFGLLSGMALTGALAVLLWEYSPVGVLLTLSGLYGVGAFWLYQRLNRLLHAWQTLPATFDQLKKDHACLDKHLA